uniref:Uncharacterized protein n=2 Tax=Anguilla anguilla TaxID=7936 RepID=A0A0E9T3M7_ANGAN
MWSFRVGVYMAGYTSVWVPFWCSRVAFCLGRGVHLVISFRRLQIGVKYIEQYVFKEVIIRERY